MSSLHSKTISGFFWSFIEKIGSRGITFFVQILLARLLTPTDFGLVGILMIFVQVSQAIIDGGFKLALIQKEDTDDKDYSTVFFINLGVSFSLYLVVFFVAPLIAEFYDQHILVPLVRSLSLVFLINGFSLVQEARLTKDIRFKTLMMINIPSTIIGGAVGWAMAILEFGVWAIVAMQVMTRLAYSIQIWFHAKWTPIFLFNKERAKRLFSFGSKLFVAQVIGTIYRNIYLVVIGKFFPISNVGYYHTASNLVNTPSSVITSVLSGVTFPVFSSIQNSNEQLKKGYSRVMQQVFFWICPLFVFAGVFAEQLFRLVLTEKWLPAVPYFQWLCIVGILAPINTYNLNILNVKGRSDIFLKLQLIRRGVTILGIIVALPYGITALLIVEAASSIFTFIFFSIASGRFIEYSIGEQLADLWPIFILGCGMGGLIFGLNQLLFEFSDFFRVFIGMFIGVGFYLTLSHLIKLQPYTDIINVLNARIKRLRK